MRDLIGCAGVNPPSPEYPQGETRDADLTADGTSIYERLLGDTIHNLHKMMDLVGENPDNTLDGELPINGVSTEHNWQLLDGLARFIRLAMANGYIDRNGNIVTGDIRGENIFNQLGARLRESNYRLTSFLQPDNLNYPFQITDGFDNGDGIVALAADATIITRNYNGQEIARVTESGLTLMCQKLGNLLVADKNGFLIVYSMNLIEVDRVEMPENVLAAGGSIDTAPLIYYCGRNSSTNKIWSFDGVTITEIFTHTAETRDVKYYRGFLYVLDSNTITKYTTSGVAIDSITYDIVYSLNICNNRIFLRLRNDYLIMDEDLNVQSQFVIDPFGGNEYGAVWVNGELWTTFLDLDLAVKDAIFRADIYYENQ